MQAVGVAYLDVAHRQQHAALPADDSATPVIKRADDFGPVLESERPLLEWWRRLNACGKAQTIVSLWPISA
jgi:hypothetical protein